MKKLFETSKQSRRRAARGAVLCLLAAGFFAAALSGCGAETNRIAAGESETETEPVTTSTPETEAESIVSPAFMTQPLYVDQTAAVGIAPAGLNYTAAQSPDAAAKETAQETVQSFGAGLDAKGPGVAAVRDTGVLRRTAETEEAAATAPASPLRKESAASEEIAGSEETAAQGAAAQGTAETHSKTLSAQSTAASASGFSALSASGAGTSAAAGASAADINEPLERIVWNSCEIENGEVVLRARMEGAYTPADTPMGEDQNFYLLELEPYENDIAGHRYSAAIQKNAEELTFRLPLNPGTAESRLYKKFVACIWDGTKYIQISEPVYVSNPEVIATYLNAYQEPLSKKGLLIELDQISDAFNLGVHNLIVNIPLNVLFGEGIDYTYEGETYHFNKTVVETYDKTISMFSNKQMNVTAILLNGWNASMPDFFLPGMTEQSAATAAYYQFNADTEAGYKDLKAIGSFLAERYSGNNPNYGRVQNWIIGNEVNNQYWNYAGAMELDSYVQVFERAFRVLYTAIRSTCANDRVFFSIDYNWMREANGSTKYNAKDFLDSFAASVILHGNIDWGLAYHPYSYPMTEPEFWDDLSTGAVVYDENSPIVNIANLSVLTDYMQRSELLDRSGGVRHIILSEQGFTSQSGTRGEVQELQAAAFAYAYYIVDSNPYIDAFILSRQIDAPSEVKQSMAFGLWTTDATEDSAIKPARRKLIWSVFRDIDKQQKTLEASAFAKGILGIEKWSDVIPNFRWRWLEK